MELEGEGRGGEGWCSSASGGDEFAKRRARNLFARRGRIGLLGGVETVGVAVVKVCVESKLIVFSKWGESGCVSSTRAVGGKSVSGASVGRSNVSWFEASVAAVDCTGGVCIAVGAVWIGCTSGTDGAGGTNGAELGKFVIPGVGGRGVESADCTCRALVSLKGEEVSCNDGAAFDSEEAGI